MSRIIIITVVRDQGRGGAGELTREEGKSTSATWLISLLLPSVVKPNFKYVGRNPLLFVSGLQNQIHALTIFYVVLQELGVKLGSKPPKIPPCRTYVGYQIIPISIPPPAERRGGGCVHLALRIAATMLSYG